MQFWQHLSGAGLSALNLALTSIVVSSTAIIVDLLVRKAQLPLRYCLLGTSLIVALACPLPIWIAVNQGLGLVPLSLQSVNGEVKVETDSQPLPTATKTRPSPPSAFAGYNMLEDTSAHKSEASSTNVSSSRSAQQGRAIGMLREPTLPTGPHRSAAEVIGRVGIVLAFTWFAIAMWLLLRLARGLFVVYRLHRSLKRTTDVRLMNAAQRAAAAMHRLPAPVYESPLAPAPLTLGWWRPVIVMPTKLIGLLDDEQLACVLAHETAHVARRDTAAALLQQLALAAFWWNPLLRIVNRQMNQLRELICDDHVVMAFGSGVPLATALVQVAEWSTMQNHRIPLAATLLDDCDSTEQRVLRLAEQRPEPTVRLDRSSAVILAGFASVLAIVPFMPVLRAQTPAPPATAEDPTKWQMHIHVVDERGTSIPHSRVGVQFGPRDEPQWQDGDESGSHTLVIPKRTPEYCYLLVRADGYAPMRAFWRNDRGAIEDPLPSEFTFEMTNSISVGGIVVDKKNSPIAGATVLFSAGDSPSSPSRRAQATFFEEELSTDDQGRWRCDLAPASIRSASLNVNHPDYAIDNWNHSQDERIEELREAKHIWVLKKGFDVTGRVLDENGNPVVGAMLAIGELNAYSHEGPFQRTDEQGCYRFERIAPRFSASSDDAIAFTISLLKPGFMPVMQSIPGFGRRPLGNSTEEERIVDFVLRPGVPFTLRILDSQNQPVQRAMIIPSHWHDTNALAVLRQFGLPAETDEQGVWSWTDAPAGESISFDVVKRDFADLRNHVITINGAALDHTIVLAKPQIITGTVIDAGTRQPIPEFVVEQAFEQVGDERFSWTGDRTRGIRGKYSKTMTMPPHNGTYTYRAIAEGYEIAMSNSIAFREGETVLNFELHPNEAAQPDDSMATINIRGQARNLKGEPIASATINLVSTNGVDKRLGQTTTDADGRYEFLEVRLPLRHPPQLDRAGTFQVYGEAAGYGFAWHGMRHYLPQARPAHAPKENDESGYYEGEPIEIDLTFRPAAKFGGIVVNENGKPVADAHLRLQSLDYLETEGHERHRNYREFWALHLMPARFHEARSGDNGRFEFSGMPKDTVGYLTVEHPRFAKQAFYVAITDEKITEYRYIGNTATSIENGEIIQKPIWETRKVRSGGQVIRLQSPAEIVVTVVYDDDDAPARNITITAVSDDAAVQTHALQETDAQGRAAMALPPGKYRVIADPPRESDYVRTYTDFELRDGIAEHRHNVRLKKGCILILEAVNAADGSPIAGVSFWHDDDRRTRRSVQSSTTYIDNPVTNEKGELRAVVAPGSRNYGVGWSPLPDGFQVDPRSRTKLVRCAAGKTIRVRFELSK